MSTEQAANRPETAVTDRFIYLQSENVLHETYSSVGKLLHKLLISLTQPTFLPLTFRSAFCGNFGRLGLM